MKKQVSSICTTVLTINAGSSSVRFALVRIQKQTTSILDSYHIKDLQSSSPVEKLHNFISPHMKNIDMVAHRLVHGGTRFQKPVRLCEQVIKELQGMISLAPLHLPSSLQWIQDARKCVPDSLPQIAVFDTAFFRELPIIAKTYALPAKLCKQHGLQRFGFHGFAHSAMWNRWCHLYPESNGKGRIITIQLGSGCSIAAIFNGKPLDTSMGFTPTEGLVMSTRSGDLDPGIVTYLHRVTGFSTDEIDDLLCKQSGLLGISGLSADMKMLLSRKEAGAKLAIEVFCYRIKKYIGSYVAVLGGLDAMIFGGGIGENTPSVRAAATNGLEVLGVNIDPVKNASLVGKEGCISPSKHMPAIWVVPVDEASEMARHAVSYENQQSR